MKEKLKIHEFFFIPDLPCPPVSFLNTPLDQDVYFFWFRKKDGSAILPSDIVDIHINQCLGSRSGSGWIHCRKL